MSRVAGFAVVPLRFGDRVIEPGDEVPYERGRNYEQMIRLGQLAPFRGEVPAAAAPPSGEAAEPKPARSRKPAAAGHRSK